MMTKKTMTILSVFMIVALTAVGFAAWLIVGTIDAETTGSFVSNELEDKYFKVEVNFDNDGEVDEEKGDIIFGRPTTDYVYSNGSWLSYSNRDPKEKLSATATVKFIPDAGFETNTMEYYLREVIEGETEEQDVTQHRTIRVVIDIVEALTDEGELDPTSDNYKWFDWAVELGYIKYPTAKIAGTETTLSWTTLASATTAEAELVDWEEADDGSNKYKKFQEACLAIDLTYDMFVVDDSDEFATVEIKIDFEWGEEVGNMNPYTFFADKEPEVETTVDNYLKVIDGTPVTYALAATTKDNDTTTDINEGDKGVDEDSVIRNKDLAQRVLDYLRDYLNYDETNESGIQFSIVLSEGTPVEVE